MHRLGAGLARHFDDALDVEIAVAGPRGAEQDGLIRQATCMASAIGLGIHRDRAQAHRLAVRITRQAISPRLAISSVRNRRYWSGPIIITS